MERFSRPTLITTSPFTNTGPQPLTGDAYWGRSKGAERCAPGGTMQELFGLPHHLGSPGPLRGHLADSSQARLLLERG